MFTKRVKPPKLDFAEIHQYTVDLQSMTELRNKSRIDSKERTQYDNIIDGMQKVMIKLTYKGDKL